MLPGKSSASRRGTFGERFSSKSSFIGQNGQAPVSISGKGKARLDVLRRQIREIVQDGGDGHSAPEVVEDIGDGNACPPNAGLATANARVDGDALSIVHK